MKVSDYIQILKIQKERFDNELDRSLAMLSVYIDEDIEEIESKPVADVHRLIAEMNDFLNKEYPVNNLVRGLYYIPNNKVTLGNFIDLETYLQNPDDFGKVCAILYRECKHNEWNHPIYEPVDFDILDRKIHFELNDIQDYIGAVQDYVKFRSYVVDTYKSIFGLDEVDEPIETDGLTPSEIKEIEEEEKKRQAKAQYSWENFVYWLAGEDLTKVETVLNFPILYALNMASMKRVYES